MATDIDMKGTEHENQPQDQSQENYYYYLFHLISCEKSFLKRSTLNILLLFWANFDT